MYKELKLPWSLWFTLVMCEFELKSQLLPWSWLDFTMVMYGHE